VVKAERVLRHAQAIADDAVPCWRWRSSPAAALSRGAGETAAQAIVRQAPGILVPGAVFAVSFWITWALYRRFSRKGL
jgi:hypothetical protein